MKSNVELGTNLKSNKLQYNMLGRWVAGSLGQITHRPSVWCCKYYSFFIISCKILCKNRFDLCIVLFFLQVYNLMVENGHSKLETSRKIKKRGQKCTIVLHGLTYELASVICSSKCFSTLYIRNAHMYELLPKKFGITHMYFVTKIVLTYCEKKLF